MKDRLLPSSALHFANQRDADVSIPWTQVRDLAGDRGERGQHVSRFQILKVSKILRLEVDVSKLRFFSCWVSTRK